MPAIENRSQHRIRTLKDPLQKYDERGAQELHLSQLVEHQQLVRLPKARPKRPNADLFERLEVDPVLPHPGSRPADPGKRAAPAVQRNDIEALPADASPA